MSRNQKIDKEERAYYKNEISGTVPPSVTNDELWQARKIKESIIHPDFNTPIPAIGRMSAFVPTNIPICAILIWPTNNHRFILGWWIRVGDKKEECRG
jgi:hypothetical protein